MYLFRDARTCYGSNNLCLIFSYTYSLKFYTIRLGSHMYYSQISLLPLEAQETMADLLRNVTLLLFQIMIVMIWSVEPLSFIR